MAKAGGKAEIPEDGFKEREQLEAWLKDQPREVSVAIAWRSIARIFPLMAGQNEYDAVLIMLRAIMIGRLATWVSYRNVDLRQAAIKLQQDCRLIIGHKLSVTADDLITIAVAVPFTVVRFDFHSYTARNAADIAQVLHEKIISSADIWEQITNDAGLCEARGILAVNEAPLWFVDLDKADFSKPVDSAEDAWVKLRRELRDQPRDHQWSVWIDWYDDILHGKLGPTRKVDIEFARLFGHPDAGVEITEDDWKAGPSIVNPKIRQVLDWFEGQRVPDVPDQRAGLGFQLNTDRRIDVADTGLPTPFDASELEGIQPLLVDAIDDLIGSCAETNAFAHIARIAQQYRAVILVPIERTSIDRMYGYGLRLDNANTHLRKEIAEGFLPSTSLTIGEALDSVIALHGTSVLATKRGQELLARSREYNISRVEDLAYKERARAFAEKFSEAASIATRRARDELTDSVEEMGTGRFPERSSEHARTINFNLLAMMGSIVLGPAFVQSVPGQMAVGGTADLFNSAWMFLSANSVVIRDLAAAAGQELSWVNSLLNWMERKQAPPVSLVATIDVKNLQQIDGVGPKLERTLKSLGYPTLEHIANWSNSDIKRVDDLLRFNGRIQNERWVEQARAILGAPALTE